MKVIGIDLDGTITPIGFCNLNLKFSLPWWLFYLLVPFIRLFSKPRKAVVEKMQLMKARGYQFIIVTARPNQFFQFTKESLIRHRVPFDGLCCIGSNKGAYERKLKIIKEEKVEMFVDSNKRIVEFMKRHSVNVVNSLDYFN